MRQGCLALQPVPRGTSDLYQSSKLPTSPPQSSPQRPLCPLARPLQHANTAAECLISQLDFVVMALVSAKLNVRRKEAPTQTGRHVSCFPAKQ